MTLQIQNFDDLLHIINTHPEWRRQLVKALFPEIDLPKALQELVESNHLWREELQLIRARLDQMEEHQGRMVVRLDQIEDQQGRMVVRLDQIEDRQGRMEDRQGRMEDRQVHMEDRQGRMELRLDRIDGRLTNVEGSVADLKGSSYENDIRNKADAIFGYLVRRGHDVRNEIGARLDAAERAEQVSADEYIQVLAADLLWGGQLKDSGEPATLVVEVSWWAETHDLERAQMRAAVLDRLGLRAIPVVAAREWPDEARQLAQERGVVIVEQFRVNRSSWQVEPAQS